MLSAENMRRPSSCQCSSCSNSAGVPRHGYLRESRSCDFAELVDVGFKAPQECIERITITDPDVTLQIKDPQMVSIHATVVTRGGGQHDALVVLNEAMECWEKVLTQIGA